MLISWSKSECQNNGWLHNYKIFAEYPNAVKEMCSICKDIKIFKTKNGRTHNITYLSYHLRQALPKYHRLYKREYGEK